MIDIGIARYAMKSYVKYILRVGILLKNHHYVNFVLMHEDMLHLYGYQRERSAA